MLSNKKALVPKTTVRVDLSLVAWNIRELKKLCTGTTRMMAVVKANAYGHGAVETAKTALGCGADYLGVARVSEAVELRKACIDAPILLFGDVDENHIEYLAANDIRVTLSTERDAVRLSKKAAAAGVTVKAHVKVDTGMGRLGIFVDPQNSVSSPTTDVKQTFDIIVHILGLEGIHVEGLYTHFANADAGDKQHALGQLKIFNDILEMLNQKGFKPDICHAANSAAIIEMPQAHFDMVRPGIAIYGLWPSDEVDKTKVELKPAMSIVSNIIQLKNVPPGFKVSYGSRHTTPESTLIATVPIGYADGYSRLLSSKGSMLVRGKKAPIVGRICMDFTMIDVGGIKGVAEGDEVVVMGCQENACITADEIAQLTGTINYEVVSALTRRMPLRHFNEKE